MTASTLSRVTAYLESIRVTGVPMFDAEQIKTVKAAIQVCDVDETPCDKAKECPNA